MSFGAVVPMIASSLLSRAVSGMFGSKKSSSAPAPMPAPTPPSVATPEQVATREQAVKQRAVAGGLASSEMAAEDDGSGMLGRAKKRSAGRDILG